MKKMISVFLALLMLMACVSISGFAADGKCTCGEGKHVMVEDACTCCVYCEYADEGAWNPCYRDKGTFCCDDCDGIRPCGCECECCIGNADIDGDKSTVGDYITEQDKNEFVSVFQSVINRLSEFFDSFFDTIFSFLGISSTVDA